MLSKMFYYNWKIQEEIYEARFKQDRFYVLK